MTMSLEELSRRAAALQSGWQRDACEALLGHAEGYLLAAETVCRQAEDLAETRRRLDEILDRPPGDDR